MIKVFLGLLYQGHWGTASVGGGVLISVPTLVLNRTQISVGCFYIVLLYYYIHIRLHYGG